ncbi:hypothetical protein ACFX11_014468 [Malus domestica]
MASSKGQAVLATTEERILSTSAANGQSIGATTAPQHATSKLVPLKEQGEHQRCESVINLTSLGAPNHAAEAHKMTSQNSQRRSSLASWMSKGKSRLLVAEVMTIGVTSIEEQMAQMNEAIARLTRIVEEKDLQIVVLVSRLEPQDDENPDPENDPLKRRDDEEDKPQVEKNDVKTEPDQAAALMGSLSIQQLQEMITNTIKAQYEGSSHTSLFYSKPYSKKIDALKMPRGYQPPPGASNQDASTSDKKGWTSATYKKMRKPKPQATRTKEEPKPAPRTSIFERLNYSKPRISALDRISGRDQTSVFKILETPTPQRSVFERLSKPKKQSGTARSPPQRSALDRLEETKKPSRNRKTTPKGEKLDSLAGKDDVQSLIPSRMKRQATLEVNTK